MLAGGRYFMFTNNKDSGEDFDGTSQEKVRGGTGFNVSSSGRIVTNYHVIEGADRISI